MGTDDTNNSGGKRHAHTHTHTQHSEKGETKEERYE